MYNTRNILTYSKIAVLVFAIALPCHASGNDDTKSYHSNSTIAKVIKRGYLKCGVATIATGFSYLDKEGDWHGFDVDICKTIAIAILGTPKVEFVPVSIYQRFDDIRGGIVDILALHTTYSFSRDLSGIVFPATYFYENLAILHRKKKVINSIKDIEGGSACFVIGTMSDLNAHQILKRSGINYTHKQVRGVSMIINAHESGDCDYIIDDHAFLAALKSNMSKPDQHTISKFDSFGLMPLGPVVRSDDIQFIKAVKWIIYVLIQSEELGITSMNIESMRNSLDYFVLNIIGENGVTNQNTHSLGLINDWAFKIIKNIGNYGEIYERNWGKDALFKIDRGLNRLYKDGGLIVSPLIV